MQLTTHQLATQEAILKRLYPGVSMEEAINRELHNYEKIDGIYFEVSWTNYEYKPIGEPILYCNKPTLPRILTALGDEYIYADGGIIHTLGDWCNVCDRQLLNEDMTDRNLREQDQETQDILHSIFCK